MKQNATLDEGLKFTEVTTDGTLAPAVTNRNLDQLATDHNLEKVAMNQTLDQVFTNHNLEKVAMNQTLDQVVMNDALGKVVTDSTLNLFPQSSQITEQITALHEQLAKLNKQKKSLDGLEEYLGGLIVKFQELAQSSSLDVVTLVKSAIASLAQAFGLEESFSPQRDRVPQSVQETDEEAELVEFPQQESQSNEYFSWELTSNKAIALFFNVAKGQTQSVYIAGESKARLRSIGSRLMETLPNISFEIRKAVRMDATYELKIKGLDDNTIGWLTKYEMDRDFFPQLALPYTKARVEPHLELTRDNLAYCENRTIKNKYHNCTATLIELEPFDTGIAQIEGGESFSIFATDWYLYEASSKPQLEKPTPAAEPEPEVPVAEPAPAAAEPEPEPVVLKLAPHVRYSSDLGCLQITFSDRSLAEGWLNFFIRRRIVANKQYSLFERDGRHFVKIQVLAEQVIALDAKFDFTVAAPTVDFYYDSRQRKAYFGFSLKGKTQRLVDKINQAGCTETPLRIEPVEILTSHKYEVIAQIATEQELNLLKCFDFNDPESAINQQVLEAAAQGVEVLDYQDIKLRIDVAMKQLGWSKEDGQEYLLQQYGKRSRLQLENDELLEFLAVLESNVEEAA